MRHTKVLDSQFSRAEPLSVVLLSLSENDGKAMQALLADIQTAQTTDGVAEVFLDRDPRYFGAYCLTSWRARHCRHDEVANAVTAQSPQVHC